MSASSSPVSIDAAMLTQMQQQIHSLHQQVQQNNAVAQQLQAVQQAVHGVAAAAGAHSGLPKIRQPSLFRGEMGFAVDDWISEMEQQFAYYDRKFPDAASRIKFAVAFFAGPAVHWWDHEPNKAAITTWADFIKTLHARFRPVQAAMIARQRLDKLRQRPGQSVNQYVNAFRTTLTPISDMGDADQVHHFVNGLLPIVAGKVWERHPKTLPDAIDYAVSVEAMSNFGRAAAPAAYNGRAQGASSPGYSSAASVPMDVNNIAMGEQNESEVETSAPRFHDEPSRADSALQAMLAKMEALEHRVLAIAGGGGASSSRGGRSGDQRVTGLKAGEIDSLMREGKCFRCKQKGHMKRDCPKAAGAAPRSVNW